MALSTEKKQTLAALYQIWGIDAVRKELDRNTHDMMAEPEVTAFARDWIASEEAKERRTRTWMAAGTILAGSLVGGVIVAIIAQ